MRGDPARDMHADGRHLAAFRVRARQSFNTKSLDLKVAHRSDQYFLQIECGGVIDAAQSFNSQSLAAHAGVRVPTLVGLFIYRKNPTEVGTLTPVISGSRFDLTVAYSLTHA